MRLLAAILMAGTLYAQDAREWINRGVQDFKMSHYQEAVADFQQAVNAEPSNVNAHLYLATAYMQMFIPGAQTPENEALPEKSATQFRTVLDLDSGNQTALMSLGSLAVNQKKWDEAQSWYEKVVAADPGNAVAWYNMGFIAWSRWYPAYSSARASMGMRLEQPGPMPAGPAKEALKANYSLILEGGLYDLQQALLHDPQYDDAMAYMNLLIRERADLRDTAVETQSDVAEANAWVDKAMAAKKANTGTRIAASMAAAPPPPPPPPPPPGQAAATPSWIRVSGNVMVASLITKVDPVYPEAARNAGISGAVALSIMVGKDGAVKAVSVQDGPKELAQAAIDAVRQWIYRPTILNNQPVEVQTTASVTFTLP